MDMVTAYKRVQLPAVNATKASVMMALSNADDALTHSSVIHMSVSKDANGYLSRTTMNAVNCQMSSLQGYSRERQNQILNGRSTNKTVVS